MIKVAYDPDHRIYYTSWGFGPTNFVSGIGVRSLWWGGGVLITPLDLAPMFQIGLMIIDETLHYYRYRVIYHNKRLARANGFSTVIRFKIFYDYGLYMISDFKTSFIGI